MGQFVKGIPDPENSPNEKFEFPALPHNIREQILADMRGERIDHDLAQRLANVLQKNHERYYWQEQRLREHLEWWANIHTHPGGAGQDPAASWDLLVDAYVTPGSNTYRMSPIYTPEGEFFDSLSLGDSSGGNQGYSAKWSPDNQYLAYGFSADSGSQFRMYDRSYNVLSGSGVPTSNAVRGVAWSLDSSLYALADSQGRCRLLELDEFNQVTLLDTGAGTAYEPAFSPDGNKLAVGASTGVFVYNISDLNNISLEWSFTSGVSHAYRVDWHPSGEHLAAGSSSSGLLLLTNTGSRITDHDETPDTVQSVRWSPDGSILAIGHNSPGKLEYMNEDFELLEGVPAVPDDPSNVNDLQWLPDSSIVGIAHSEGTTFITRDKSILHEVSQTEDKVRRSVAVKIKE